jgi:HAD superfamily hydrolase (TIGR01450 family)
VTESTLARVRHVVLDLDGTLYRGGRLFPATRPFLDRLRRLGVGASFLTNNTSLSKADYVAKLRKLGIDAGEGDVYTPADSTIVYLREKLTGVTRLAVLGTPSLCRQFEETGFAVAWDEPQAVVVGFDTTLTYERLCKTAYWVKQGLPFIATHPDLVCPTDEPTVLVDCGSITACLTAATGRAPVVLGKPDPRILLDLCDRLGMAPAEMCMVGDRIYTDVAMAQKAGVPAVLVLTGEATVADAAAAGEPRPVVVGDVGELGELLERAKCSRGL